MTAGVTTVLSSADQLGLVWQHRGRTSALVSGTACVQGRSAITVLVLGGTTGCWQSAGCLGHTLWGQLQKQLGGGGVAVVPCEPFPAERRGCAVPLGSATDGCQVPLLNCPALANSTCLKTLSGLSG